MRCLKSGTMHGRNKTRGLVERSPAMLSVIFFRQDFVADLPLRPWICSRIGGRVVIVSGVDAGAAILCGSASLASGYRGECFVCGLHTTGIHEGSHAASCLQFVTHELIGPLRVYKRGGMILIPCCLPANTHAGGPCRSLEAVGPLCQGPPKIAPCMH